MKHAFDVAVGKWGSYWQGSLYPWLLIAALLIAVFAAKKKNKVFRDLLLVTAVLGFICFFPPTAYVIQKCIGNYFYFRVYWVLPASILLCGALAYQAASAKSLLLRIVLVAAGCAVIAFAGRSQHLTGNYELLHNRQKVPDDVAQVCEIIEADFAGRPEEERIKVASNDHMASFMRVYDAAIRMPYGRAGRYARGYRGNTLYELMEDGDRNYAKLAILGSRTECNYLVVPLSDGESAGIIEENGYEMIAQVNSYGVFHLAGGEENVG